MTAYYNEFDPHAAEWLEGLISEGLIAHGVVDRRSITEVSAADIAGFTQVHFFSGIGGWSLALRLAGWPDDRAVWTGSCPCQPFSLAGKQKGFDDARHLWPEFKRLIAERRPATVFGEQVASASAWLGLVRSDLEALEYAVGAMPIEAASAGADHLRDRYWFVGRDNMAHHHHQGPQGRIAVRECSDQRLTGSDGVADAASQRQREQTDETHPLTDGGQAWAESGGSGSFAMADDEGDDEQRDRILETSRESQIQTGRLRDAGANPSHVWVIGADGKARRVKRGIRLLAHGVRGRVVVGGSRSINRVGVLKGFGNAIDPRPAAAFISAYMDCCG